MSKRSNSAPSFMGLIVASAVLRIVAAICILVGFILTIFMIVKATESSLGAGGMIMTILPGLSILLYGVFMLATGEALIALKIIAQSTDETAYVLRRKLMR